MSQAPSRPRYGWAGGRWLLALCCAAGALLPLRALLLGAAPWGAAALLLGALLALLLCGVFLPRAGVFARPLIAGPRHRPRVALTFDDGPHPEETPRVLALLQRHGARATFFLIGEKAAAQPELVRALAAAGHQVENHSQRHRYDLALLPVGQVVRELEEAQRTLGALCGRRPRWLRSPAGVLSPPLVEAARRCGLRLCAWSAKAIDGVAGTTAEAALRRLTRGLAPGAILLLHDGVARGPRRPIAAEVLERLLPLMAQRGLEAVTLEELLT